jgi:hypothetical protein
MTGRQPPVGRRMEGRARWPEIDIMGGFASDASPLPCAVIYLATRAAAARKTSLGEGFRRHALPWRRAAGFPALTRTPAFR